MRTVLRYLFLALVLLVVALASALTAMRYAIHGREVEVPKLVGMSPSEAERVALANGLIFSVENRFYSPEVPEGRVLTQVPAAGDKVRRGSRVRVAESLGPQRVLIPDVVGQSRRAAEINLTRRGIEVGTAATATLPGAVDDTVAAQSPPPEATGVTAPKVNLLIAKSPADDTALLMPDLVGRTLEEASQIVAAGGLAFGEVKSTAAVGAATTGAPVVVKQHPAAGEKVLPGTSVHFEVVR